MRTGSFLPKDITEAWFTLIVFILLLYLKPFYLSQSYVTGNCCSVDPNLPKDYSFFCKIIPSLLVGIWKPLAWPSWSNYFINKTVTGKRSLVCFPVIDVPKKLYLNCIFIGSVSEMQSPNVWQFLLKWSLCFLCRPLPSPFISSVCVCVYISHSFVSDSLQLHGL